MLTPIAQREPGHGKSWLLSFQRSDPYIEVGDKFFMGKPAMAQFSYATERKLRIIQERVGDDWRDQYPNQSIDAVFNQIVGDTRKTLFCKLDAEVKQQLDTMTKDHGVRIGEFLEELIKKEYDRYVADQQRLFESVSEHYGRS